MLLRGNYFRGEAITDRYSIESGISMPFTFVFPPQSNYSSSKNQALKAESLATSLFAGIGTNRRTYLSGLVCAIFLVTGCGGTPDYPVEDGSGSAYSQASDGAYAATTTRSNPSSAASASSFTVNSTENFNGFNPEDWNNQQSWVECNCGNNQTVEPRIMTWNPNA